MNELPELIGLVLAGGESRRMGTDKSLLSYHGIPQREHLYHLLQEFCKEVYICCKPSQAVSIPPAFRTLIDEQNDIGPIAALLTAFHHFPDASFIVLACDYPLIGKEDIQLLLEQRKPGIQAISFINPETKIPEALLGIYEHSCQAHLTEEVALKNYSLRFFIQNIPSLLIPPRLIQVIQSIDTPEQRSSIV